jgi:hypothetical protein
MNTVKYDDVFCGIIYGCPECGNTFTDKGYTVYSTGQDFLDAMDEIIAHNETHSG